MNDDHGDEQIAISLLEQFLAQTLPEVPDSLSKIRLLTENPSDFGSILLAANGPLLGRYARFKGGSISRDGTPSQLDEMVGQIVADISGQIIIAVEERFEIYSLLGWLKPDDYEVVSVVIEEQKWHH